MSVLSFVCLLGEIRDFCGRATPSVLNYSILLFEGALFDLIEQVCLPGECIRIKRKLKVVDISF